jgi:hypothetical protein
MTQITFENQVRLSRNLQRIAKMLDKELEKAAGVRGPWSLYTWGGQRCQYVSNSPREETKAAMQECLDRWNQPDDPPPHQWGG